MSHSKLFPTHHTGVGLLLVNAKAKGEWDVDCDECEGEGECEGECNGWIWEQFGNLNVYLAFAPHVARTKKIRSKGCHNSPKRCHDNQKGVALAVPKMNVDSKVIYDHLKLKTRKRKLGEKSSTFQCLFSSLIPFRCPYKYTPPL